MWMRSERTTGRGVSVIIALFLLGGGILRAQEVGEGILPGDVLNPDARSNTPNVKVALKLGLNRGVFTNDRFIDNRPFDVGIISGEEDAYGSAAGFGYQVGLEVELPQNSVFSWSVGLRYDRINLGNGGPVTDICRTTAGDSIGPSALHSFDLDLEYLKIAGAAKLNFRDFYLLFGLTGSTPLSSSVLFTREHRGEPCFYPDVNDIRNSTTPVEVPDMSNLIFALRLGGGLTWDLTDRIQFSPELTLDFGMSSINKSPESDIGVYALNGVFRIDL